MKGRKRLESDVEEFYRISEKVFSRFAIDCTLREIEQTDEKQVKNSEKNIAGRTFRLIFSSKEVFMRK